MAEMIKRMNEEFGEECQLSAEGTSSFSGRIYYLTMESGDVCKASRIYLRIKGALGHPCQKTMCKASVCSL